MGAVIWLVPFVVSLGFIDGEGKFTITKTMLKSVVIAISTLAGCFMLHQYFKQVVRDYFIHGVATAVVWLLINWFLDIAIFAPLSGMSMRSYFESVGVSHLQIPILCIVMGVLFELRSKSCYMKTRNHV
ncbi:hypothetical protein DQQ10_08800 [Pseudochryseolinea flava]|uniref:Uncharacterized protein n=2 Tax=Pseudochryseolinea flava TaxID=2059302 RepID=A0A364Y4D7_9BACT|nr:hypothetical protein DQQ10_08800 [Pseudochryseolinea flava]